MSVVEDKEAHSKTCQGSTQMTHEPCSVVRFINPHIDSKPDVVKSQQKDESYTNYFGDRSSDNLEVHKMIFDPENNVKNIYFLYFDIVILAPVEEQGSEMSRYQSIDSATSTR